MRCRRADDGETLRLVSKVCGHEACEPCWRDWSASKLEKCRSKGWLRAPCLAPGCGECMDGPIWERMCEIVPQAFAFSLEVGAAELQLCAADSLTWTSHSSLQEGPVCIVWAHHRPVLLKNGCCGHSVCPHCWLTPVRCDHGATSALQCPVEGCSKHASKQIQKYVIRRFAEFESRVQVERQVLADLASAGHHVTVDASAVVSFSTESWPTCPMCCEPAIGLVSGSARCRHASCLGCWSNWSRDQSHVCCRNRRMCVHCFSLGCDAEITTGLWHALCAREVSLLDMDRSLQRRRALQQNRLYPAEVQVDCPMPSCVGLGYLGHDTVMCFICEHQWVSDGPRQLGEDDVLAGGKACPKCGAYIEKTGGCDHMTYRCGHELWWTTLASFRR